MGCLSLVLYVLALIWALLIPLGQVATNIVLSGFLNLPKTLFIALPIIQAGLLILPFLPFAIFLKNHSLRRIFQVWVAAALVGLILSPIQMINQSSAQLRAVVSIGIGTLMILANVVIGWFKYPESYSIHIKSILQPFANMYLVPIFCSLYFYPWLIWGALGSLVDTLIMLANALIFGILAALILDVFLFHSLDNRPMTTKNFLLAGTSASVVLYIFASGLNFPFGGMQGLIMISLPWTAWIVTLLYRSNLEGSKNPLLAMVILLSGALSAPMLFIDPDELALMISATEGEIGVWAITASLVSATVACLFGVAMLIWRAKSNQQFGGKDLTPITRAIRLITIIIILTGGIVLYYFVGQPGWNGEQLFVILKDQKVITQAISIDNYQERRSLVYQSLVQHASESQSDLIGIFDKFNIQYRSFYLVNAIQVEGGPLIRLWLMTRPEVDRILDNPILRPLPEEPPIQRGPESLPSDVGWNITQIEADRVWQDFDVTGKGIVIGQSDSGVQWDHPELLDSYRGNGGNHDFNWLDPWNNTLEPVDNSSHGTHTLGTILGNHTGIAPDATWYACANLVRNLGNPAFYLDCMQFMLAPYPIGGDAFTDGDPSRGAHIINNSWGCPELEGCDADTFLSAVANLHAAGIFVVASAGNDGPGCGTLKYPPANYQDSFSVGAVDRTGGLAYFSSIGPAVVSDRSIIKPDLVAPGVDILSSTPGNTYALYSGTSMAGPHVVGVVALMWSANPSLIGDIDKTTQILIESATDYTGALPNCPGATDTQSTAVGYGVLNAYQAVELALQSK